MRKFFSENMLQYLEARPELTKITLNTGWLFIDKFLRLGVGLFVGVWIVRYLGPDQFGLLSYAQAFVSLFASFAALGIDGIVVRNIVRDPDVAHETMGTAFILKLAGGFLTMVFSLGIISYMRPLDTQTFFLVGIIAAGSIFQAFDTIDLWFQSRVSSKYTVYARNAAFTVVSLLKVALILAGAPLLAFAWAGLAEVVLGAIGLVLVYRVNGQTLRDWSASLGRAKELIRDSWPLILSGLAIYIQARIDQVMIGEMMGDAELGQYSAALRLIEFLGFVPVIIYSSVAPAITKAKSEGPAVFHKRLLNIYRLMFILFLVTSVPIYLISDRIVLILYGEQYQTAGMLLSLLSIRLFFTNFGVAKGLFIANENLFKYSLVTAIAGSLVNIFLNYLLIPDYKSVGAIWAAIASFFVTTFFIDLFYSKTRENLKLMLSSMLTFYKVMEK